MAWPAGEVTTPVIRRGPPGVVNRRYILRIAPSYGEAQREGERRRARMVCRWHLRLAGLEQRIIAGRAIHCTREGTHARFTRTQLLLAQPLSFCTFLACRLFDD